MILVMSPCTIKDIINHTTSIVRAYKRKINFHRDQNRCKQYSMKMRYQQKFRIIILISVVISASLGLHRTPYDDSCKLDDQDVLQVAFVLDRTYTIEPMLPQLGEVVPKILDRLNKRYPKSEFAITLFADWEIGARSIYNQPKTLEARAGSELYSNTTHGCYFRYLKFNQDAGVISDYVANIKNHIAPSGGEENSLSALGFTVSDPKLGWDEDFIDDENGKQVHRFVVLITDADSITGLGNPGERKPFRGDGTDTCETSLPPTYDELAVAFDTHRVSVVALLSKEYIPDIEEKYKNHFQEINKRRPVEYCDALIDKHGTSDELGGKIAECFKSLLKCAFSDPPAFNTLGL